MEEGEEEVPSCENNLAPRFSDTLSPDYLTAFNLTGRLNGYARGNTDSVAEATRSGEREIRSTTASSRPEFLIPAAEIYVFRSTRTENTFRDIFSPRLFSPPPFPPPSLLAILESWQR